MFQCYELFAVMSPSLGEEILDFASHSDKALYRTTLDAVAEARKVRPIFFERKPRPQRQLEMRAALSSPRLEEAAASLLRAWLLNAQTPMLKDFLGGLGITHQEGIVDTFPVKVEDAALSAAVEGLLVSYRHEKVAIYLHVLYTVCEARWPYLALMLQHDERLQIGWAVRNKFETGAE